MKVVIIQYKTFLDFLTNDTVDYMVIRNKTFLTTISESLPTEGYICKLELKKPYIYTYAKQNIIKGKKKGSEIYTRTLHR